MKIVYKGDTKRVTQTHASYQDLIQHILRVFQIESDPFDFKLFYQDEDNELISISCQGDLEQAFKLFPKNKLRLELCRSATEIEDRLNRRNSELSCSLLSRQNGFKINQFLGDDADHSMHFNGDMVFGAKRSRD